MGKKSTIYVESNIHISAAVYGLFTSITNKQKGNKTKNNCLCFLFAFCLFVCFSVQCKIEFGNYFPVELPNGGKVCQFCRVKH